MIPVLSVCLALAVIAAVWLGARSARLSSQLREASEKADTMDAAAQAAAEKEAILAADLAEATDAATAATQRADVAEQARTAAESDLSTAREAAAAAEASSAAAEARAEEADDRADAAETELARIVARQADVETADAEWRGGPGPEVLWALERTRTERTWRTSVAVDPTADAFDLEDDPLRHAIEIDLSALREEVGVEFALAWELDQELTSIASLAVLRSTQELIAEATRLADEATVVVALDGDDVTVTVTETDGTTGRFGDLGDGLAGRGLDVVPGRRAAPRRRGAGGDVSAVAAGATPPTPTTCEGGRR